ncbi:MAG: 1,4-dihydroxy-2-naphthoate octaprenyltransferase [Crocinitomicaceae bacterium]|nr:1,4-dihydroxy-2-naphthoate octaprenyltransferase [Crocinitomicaceae bacterium]
MDKLKAWIHAFRLRTLPLSFSGIIFGSFIAYNDGIWDSLIFGFAMLTTVLFQILSNLANDLGDSLKGTDNLDRVGPTRAVQSGKISMREMKNAVILFSILSIISAVALIFISSEGKGSSFFVFYLILALLSIFAAITYTIGKKAYGYNGLGDVFVFIFFGLVSTIGVYNLYPERIDLSNFKWEILLPAASIGFLSVAVLNLNNMRDRINDEKVGKNTLVVKMGGNIAKIYHAVLILLSIIFWSIYLVYFHGNNPWLYILLFPALMLLLHVRRVLQIRTERSFDPELKVVALTTFAASIFFALSIILNQF